VFRADAVRTIYCRPTIQLIRPDTACLCRMPMTHRYLVYVITRPQTKLRRRMSDCIDDVSTWMKANRLLLNHNKTEVLWSSSSRRQHQIPTAFVRVGRPTSDVQPVSVVRKLGVYINSDATLRANLTATVRACFAALRQIRSVYDTVCRAMR